MHKKKDILNGLRVLVVDDEPDILGSLEETLDMCLIETAGDFETARDLLETHPYDAAVLDIMGVRGYDLLEIATAKEIPTLMLTAHALSADNLVKSLKEGARGYVPKDKISEINTFLRDILQEKPKKGRLGRWFSRLEPFFKEKFGEYWKEKSDPEFWQKLF
jgi:DNA-binding response OmpR family regulator